MSAAAAERSDARRELELAPSRGLPRRMKLEVNRFGELSVVVWGRSGAGRHGRNGMLAYASSELATARLSQQPREYPFVCLWLERIAFDLSPSEAKRVAAAFPEIRREGVLE